jgi:flavin-dependent amine oxidoreductase
VDLMMESLDFAPDTRFFLLDEGFEAVPWSLQTKFENAGGKVIWGEWLQEFAPAHTDAGTKIELRFRSGHRATTRALILAMPRHALIPLLTRRTTPAGDRVGSLLDSVTPLALFKMFLLYPAPWWQKVASNGPNGTACAGRSYTDTPIRQCWYWHSVECGPRDRKAMIMAYCDLSNVRFWEGFRRGGAQPPLEPCALPGGDRLDRNWTSRSVPAPMLDEMHRQLAILHGVDPQSAPRPLDAAYMDWTDEPYGGAVHLWNRGQRSWEMIETAVHPIPDLPCYVCGEAYSTNQTWVEGALQTADMVLEKHLGLEPRT